MRHLIVQLYILVSISTLFAQGNSSLQISHLTNDFYVYTTYNEYEGYRIPANGMYILTNNGVILIDTPWDTTQFQPLLDSINIKHNKNVVMCLVTHWHSDKTEGLEYYKSLGIKTYSTVLTDELCQKNNKKRAEFLMTKDTLFNVGKYSFETYFPGEGHTSDNIVIWFDNEKILYGGCLIKGAEAKNLGFLGDANVSTYKSSLENVRRKYPDPNYIVVSHSDWKDINSLKHSIKLAKKLKRKH